MYQHSGWIEPLRLVVPLTLSRRTVMWWMSAIVSKPAILSVNEKDGACVYSIFHGFLPHKRYGLQ